MIVSLIDGHEEALSLPFTIKFLSIWKKNKLDNVKDKKVIINTFLLRSKLHRFNSSLNEYSYVNGEKFKDSFEKLIHENKLSFQNTLYAIFLSYAKSINKDISKIKAFFADSYYHVNEVEEYLNYFPNSKFIRIMRDPRSNIQSLSRHLLFYQKTMHPPVGAYRKRSLPLHILKDIMLNSLKFSFNEEKNKNIHKIIKYEDILNNTEIAMKDFCLWTGLKFDNIMLKITRDGKPYSTYSKTQNQIINKVEKKLSFSWIKSINKLNLRAYEFLFLDCLKRFNYNLNFSDTKFNKFLGFLCCFYPWENEILPKLKILKGKNKINFYNLLKSLIFIISNIVGFFISRIKLCFYILKGDFK